MTDILTSLAGALAVVAVEALRYALAGLVVLLLPACLYISTKGEDIRLALVARSERRAVDKRNRAVRRLVEGGRISRRTERALHNDYDYACVHWWGDRNPGITDTSNREFDGSPTSIGSRRCTICNPITPTDEDVFLGYSEATGALALRDEVDAYIRDSRRERRDNDIKNVIRVGARR